MPNRAVHFFRVDCFVCGRHAWFAFLSIHSALFCCGVYFGLVLASPMNDSLSTFGKFAVRIRSGLLNIGLAVGTLQFASLHLLWFAAALSAFEESNAYTNGEKGGWGFPPSSFLTCGLVKGGRAHVPNRAVCVLLPSDCLPRSGLQLRFRSPTVVCVVCLHFRTTLLLLLLPWS